MRSRGVVAEAFGLDLVTLALTLGRRTSLLVESMG